MELEMELQNAYPTGATLFFMNYLLKILCIVFSLFSALLFVILVFSLFFYYFLEWLR